LTYAWRLGVTKIPAVVDGRYVIYGEPDVAKATARIAAFRNRKP
jgi:integrating conjugative element protein (TIGR03757 family)